MTLLTVGELVEATGADSAAELVCVSDAGCDRPAEWLVRRFCGCVRPLCNDHLKRLLGNVRDDAFKELEEDPYVEVMWCCSKCGDVALVDHPIVDVTPL